MSTQLYTTASPNKGLLLPVILCAAVLFSMDTPVPGIAKAWAQDGQATMPGQNSALLPESWARKAALTNVMPTYPEEAVRLGISGVVQIRFETNPEGQVIRIKVKPGTPPLLSKAVVDVVKDRRFKPWSGAYGLPEPVLSRLGFNFVLDNGVSRVEMFYPGPPGRATECLGCSNSNKEIDQWRDWDEAWSKSNPGAPE